MMRRFSVTRLPRRAARALLAFGVVDGASRTAHAQCVEHHDEIEFGHLHGFMIAQIAVRTESPQLVGVLRAALRLHARTSPATLRRLFDEQVGTRVDSLHLQESLRRVRTSSLFAHVSLRAVECASERVVRLTVETTDAWSTSGKVRLSHDGAIASVGDDNFLGRARSVNTSLRYINGQLGFGMHYVDPWLAGSPFSLALEYNRARDVIQSSVRLSTAPPRLLDPWRGDVEFSRSAMRSFASLNDRVARTELHALVERRIFIGAQSVFGVTFGMERSVATLETRPSAALVGPARVARDFSGVGTGFTRRSLVYDRLPDAFAFRDRGEYPVTVELDIAASVGRDDESQRAMQHVDAWLGKIWSVGERSLVSANGWWSGYRSGSSWAAGDARASVLLLGQSGGARWSMRAAAEALLDPDPDMRAFVTLDPTSRLLPTRGLAEAASMFSAERGQSFHSIGRAYDLGGALFVAASRRWDLATVGGDTPRNVALIGGGLRLYPTRSRRATFNLDVAVPYGASRLTRGPLLSFGITPWFLTERRRNGGVAP